MEEPWQVASSVSMIFVPKPLTQLQQNEDDENQDYKHKADW